MKKRIIVFIQIIAFVLTIFAGISILTTPVYATNIVVTNGSDSGAGSLRAALSTATNGDVITFDSSVTQINIIGAVMNVPSVLIDGGLNADGTPKVSIISTSTDSLFNYTGTGQFKLRGLAIQSNGDQTTNLLGSVLYSDSGDIIVNDCTFTGINQLNCSAIYAINGDVTLVNSNFSSFSNYSSSNGGAVIAKNGNVSVDGCTFTNNVAVYGGGIYANSGDVTVRDSTFQTGSAANGGGICATVGDVTVYNCTLANNGQGIGGAIYTGFGDIMIYNSSLTYNYAFYGSALISEASGDIILVNSTLYGNYTSNQFDYDSAVIEAAGETIIIQSTITNNQAVGIIPKIWGIPSTVPIYAYNSIIVDNTDLDGNPKQSSISIIGGQNIIEDVPNSGDNTYDVIFGDSQLINGHIAPLETAPNINTAPQLTSADLYATNLTPSQITTIMGLIQKDALGNVRVPPIIFGAVQILTSVANYLLIKLLVFLILLLFGIVILFFIRSRMCEKCTHH